MKQTLGLLLLGAALGAQSVAVQVGTGPETTARIIVKFKDTATKAEQTEPQRVGALSARRGVALRHLRSMARGANVVVADHEMSIDEAEAWPHSSRATPM